MANAAKAKVEGVVGIVTNRDIRFEPNHERLVREVMYGLNRTERRTWLLLLLGLPILEVACKEKVSRAAIYERIRGNSKGQGGMIRKNDYVEIWWRNQRKKNNNEQ